MSLASGIKLMFLVINQWNRMEGGGNYRVDEGGVSYSPHQCVFSVTPHTDACRWRTDGVVTCAYIMNRFFFPCMIIFKDFFLIYLFFFIEGFICRSPSLHNSSCRRKKRTWQMTVKGWDKTELLGGGGDFLWGKTLHLSVVCCESVWRSNFSCSPLWLTGCKVLLVEIVPLWLWLCVFKGDLGAGGMGFPKLIQQRQK